MKVEVEEAAHRLRELMERAAAGDEVIISDGEQSVRLVLCSGRSPRPVFGSARGLIWMSDDFDEPLLDCERSH